MDDRTDIERNVIDADILSKGRFRNGLSVKFKDGNRYRFGVISFRNIDNNGELVYVIKYKDGNGYTFTPVHERFIMPTTNVGWNTPQDAQKPAQFPF